MSKRVDIHKNNNNIIFDNFTSLIMTAALDDTTVTYEDLAELEKDFEEAEIEISESKSLFHRMLVEKLVCHKRRR